MDGYRDSEMPRTPPLVDSGLTELAELSRMHCVQPHPISHAYAHVYQYVYASVYTHIYAQAFLYVYARVCTHTYARARAYVHVYTHGHACRSQNLF